MSGNDKHIFLSFVHTGLFLKDLLKKLETFEGRVPENVLNGLLEVTDDVKKLVNSIEQEAVDFQVENFTPNQNGSLVHYRYTRDGYLISEKFRLLLGALSDKIVLDILPGLQSGYYCGLCDYCTTLYALWENHKSSQGHNDNVSETAVSVSCPVCGVYILVEGTEKDIYMTSIDHTIVDKIITIKSQHSSNMYLKNGSEHCSEVFHESDVEYSAIKPVTALQKANSEFEPSIVECLQLYKYHGTTRGEDNAMDHQIIPFPKISQSGALAVKEYFEHLSSWLEIQLNEWHHPASNNSRLLYFCTICKTGAINSFWNMFQHLIGVRHRRLIEFDLDLILMFCNSCSTSSLIRPEEIDSHRCGPSNTGFSKFQDAICAPSKSISEVNFFYPDFTKSEDSEQSPSVGSPHNFSSTKILNDTVEHSSVTLKPIEDGHSRINGDNLVRSRMEFIAENGSTKQIEEVQSFDKALHYIHSRYSIEGFVPGTFSFFYCNFCQMGVSYFELWNRHFSTKLHANNSSKKKGILSYCKNCGLMLLTEESSADYFLKSNHHLAVDSMLQGLNKTNKSLLTPQNIEECKLLEKRNESFISKMQHTSCCRAKAQCTLSKPYITSKSIWDEEDSLLHRGNICTLTQSQEEVRGKTMGYIEEPSDELEELRSPQAKSNLVCNSTKVKTKDSQRGMNITKENFTPSASVEYILFNDVILNANLKYPLIRCFDPSSVTCLLHQLSYLIPNSQFNSLKYLCLSCNKFYQNLDQIMNHCVKNCKQYGNPEDRQAMLCIFCNTFCVSHKYEFEEHMKSPRHITVLGAMKNIWKYDGSQIDPEQHQIEETMKRVCNIFKHLIFESTEVEKKKLSPPRCFHLIKMNEQSSDYLIKGFLENKKVKNICCMLCDRKIVDVKYLENHLGDEVHRNQKKISTKLNENRYYMDCAICAILFLEVKESFNDSHIISCGHILETQRALDEYFDCGPITSKMDTSYSETVVDTSKNETETKIDSLLGGQHIDEEFGKEKDTEDKFPVLKEVDVNNILKYLRTCSGQSERLTLRIQFSCIICNVSSQGSYEIFTSHLIGKKHRASVLMKNPIGLFCKPCRLFMIAENQTSLDEHFLARKHVEIVEGSPLKSQQAGNLPHDGEEGPNYNVGITDRCATTFSSIKTLMENTSQILKDMKNASRAYTIVRTTLEKDLLAILKPVYPSVAIYFFGSRETGLAKGDSDVDIFVDIGNCYNGMGPYYGKEVGKFSDLFSQAESLFDVKEVILDTRIPVIKMDHVYTEILCDLNTVDGSGVENSKLLKVYLALDDRVPWLIATVGEWAASNCIRGPRAFNSYSIAWMVLFFLMQPETNLVPPVLTLMELHCGEKCIINGWDYSFLTDVETIKAKHNPDEKCDKSYTKLLELFFRYYSMLKTQKVLISPLTGEILRRSMFITGNVPLQYRNVIDNTRCIEKLKIGCPIILLDPLLLKFNLLRHIKNEMLEHFQLLCLEMLENEKWIEY